MATARYTPDAACFDAANQASGERLSREQIEAAFQRVYDYKQKLQAEGNLDGMADKLQSFAEREAERTKVAAALQKRHAALNILARDRLNVAVTTMMDQGMSPKKALLAILEGTQKGVKGGRNSVAALTNAYEARYLGGMMADLEKTKPHLVYMLRDKKMDSDITIEMMELREGGQPGITRNKDAQDIARIFATYAEMSRKDLNQLGASIGKLDGWAGPQVHDDIKIQGAGRDAWIQSTLPRLDVERTFGDVDSADEIYEMMSGIYDTIVTGFSNRVSAKEKGQRVNPSNMAKQLGKSRVLHFKDAETAIEYRDQFGHGNTVSGMIDHLRRSARYAANMDALGPNPEVMLNGLVESMKRRVKTDATLTDRQKQGRIKALDTEAGGIRHAIDIATGTISRPVNVTGAKIGADIRATQSMAKLGGAVFSAIGGDNVTQAIASQFRGSGFFRGLLNSFEGMLKGRPKGEQAEISYLLGEGFDGIIGHIVAPSAAIDGPVGKMSSLQEKFFRWNRLTWWTDVQRSTAARVISAEMGMRSGADYANLPPKYRHVLGLSGIDSAQWDAIRAAPAREANGKKYITPDAIRGLSDEAVEPLVANRIEAARTASKIDEAKTAETRQKREAAFAERRAQILDDGRRNLELALSRFVSDESSYAMLEVDARTRRTMTVGTRPGTVAGEAMRFIGQFKGFPMTFTQRTFGRALFGHRKDASWLERSAHIGSLLGGMTMAGYMSLTLKDIARGYWPPRDPSDPKTWAAAFVQGGAAGIYGDFLFSRVNRFGGGLAETAIGPSFGAGFDLIELILKARDAGLSSEEEVRVADYINLATQNTPFVNLFYTRPAIDYLFLNSLRESFSPGFKKRQEGRRREDYGQEFIGVEPMDPFNAL